MNDESRERNQGEARGVSIQNVGILAERRSPARGQVSPKLAKRTNHAITAVTVNPDT
jgi:hypothetical protein